MLCQPTPPMGLTAGDLRSQQLQSALVNKERIEREKQEVGCPDDPLILHRNMENELQMSCFFSVLFLWFYGYPAW